MEELDDQKNAVLVDNTAQAVFKHLDRIRDGRAILGTRWIWELLQNARDVASEAGVAVQIEVSASHLIFRHNGKPFRVEDVTHLIYHGSTKVDLEGAVGRYGSGFLSTHLVSPVVRLRGSLTDGRRFDFAIDRSGLDVHGLSVGMERSWQAFKISLRAEHTSHTDATAEFEYPLDANAHELVAAGLEQLRVCVSLILAFAPELVSIYVATPSTNWRMTRADATALTDSVSLLRIESQESGDTHARFVARVGDANSTICALPLEAGNAGMQIALTPSVPRLYVLFPMVTTERLPLPVAISSLQFKPREDRDGIYLRGETEGPTDNRRILEQAVHQISDLIRCAAAHGWDCIEQIVAFDTSDLPDWLDHDWYVTLSRELLQVVRETPLLRLESNRQIAPQEALLPFAEDEAKCVSVARFAASLRNIGAKLPRADQIPTWHRNVAKWAQLLGVHADDLPEVLTIKDVARHVAGSETLPKLQENLCAAGSAVEWLGGLVQHILDSGLGTLLDELPLLPAQNGTLKRRSDLHFDAGIAEEIKDIAAELDLDLRSRLLDPRISVSTLSRLLAEMTQEGALAEVVQHLRAASDDGRMPSNLVEPSTRLFGWIVAHADYVMYLWGLPLATMDGDGESISTFELAHRAAEEERPLAPTALWPAPQQEYVSLFPKRKILHESFGRLHVLRDSWDRLSDDGIVHLGPLYSATRKPRSFLSDDTFSEEAGEHEATEAVTVFNIAYLGGDDYAVLDTIRKSHSRALEFIRFMFELANDAARNSLETLTLQCVCGQSHRVYRGEWLEPVRSRTWVPGGPDGRRTSKLSAESLAELVEKAPDIVHDLAQEPGAKLLTALAISPADFMLRVVAKDEDSRVSLIRSMGDLTQAAGGDLDRVRQLVEEIRQHPEIIDEIGRQRAQRDRVLRNQQIGGHVEELLRVALASEGLSVKRTGVGSDFEVDYDLIEEGQEVVLDVAPERSSTLVEIKSTRVDGAKMTPRQADTALSNGERFALCVVDLGDAEPAADLVRDRCRFVFGLGERLQAVWTQYQSIQTATAVAMAQGGPISIDVVEGQYRFMIGREVWETGLTFDQAVAIFRSGGRSKLGG